VNTLIFRTIAPLVVAVMLVFSLFVLLRGHNAPGGGFIGGLIGAAAMAVNALAGGPGPTRTALRVDPMAIAGFGVLLAAGSGLLSRAYGLPFLTGLWSTFSVGGQSVAVSTPMVFDIGVYAVVFGTVSALGLALMDAGGSA
jgi:multicomponent Na+:H+ antiporter subunit B